MVTTMNDMFVIRHAFLGSKSTVLYNGYIYSSRQAVPNYRLL